MPLGEVIKPELTQVSFSIGIIYFVSGGAIAWFFFKHFYLKKLKFELAQKKESLEFVLESGRMGTWVVNLETNKVYCSDVMLKLWNVPLDFDGNRQTLQEKVFPEDRQKMVDALSKAQVEQSTYEFEYRIIPAPGVVKWVISRGRVIFSQDKKPIGLAGVVYDITERKIKEEADAAIARARDQFFMIAGHELKTPLTCLHLQLQVQEWEITNSPENALLNINKQRRHLSRITRIVDNMLDQSKIEERSIDLHLEKFNLAYMVQDVIDEFSVTAQNSNVEIFFESTGEIKGKWDRFRLEQVLFNLLINALRYGNKKPIYVSVISQDGHALIKVRDEGIGIKKEDHHRIFEKFERAVSDDNRDGIGLGLFISNNIVKAHKGSIELQSESGKGSEFTVVLPV